MHDALFWELARDALLGDCGVFKCAVQLRVAHSLVGSCPRTTL